MESFTSLKGFNNYNDIDPINKVQQSVIMFLDWGFLDKGAFTNIYIGHSDIGSNNQSILRKVDDPNYSDGQVWETFRRHLVWESGVTASSQPISISGVYVDGSFKTSGTTGYEHYVDYENGRVIFNSPISATTVKMEYSYKNIIFDKGNPFEYPQAQLNSYDFRRYNVSASGQWSVLNKTQMPLVSVEVSPKIDYSPVSLGTGASYLYTDILFHIFDTNDINVNKLLSLISLQNEKTIYMLDMDLMYSSGTFPLDYRGAKNINPKTYPNLINGGYRHAKLRFADVTANGSNQLGDVYHGVVRFTTETITTV